MAFDDESHLRGVTDGCAMVKSQAVVQVPCGGVVSESGLSGRGVGFPIVTYDAPAAEGAELRYGC